MNKQKNLFFIISIFIVFFIIFSYNKILFAGSFQTVGEYYRYFEDDGSVAHDKIVEVDRDLYYVNTDGYATFNSWVNKDSKYYYAGNDGKLYKGGIKEIEGYKYYFGDDCELQKGWVDDYNYYGDYEDGFLLTGFQELEIPKSWYTEVTNENEGWFYFDTNTCKKYYSTDEAYVCKTVGGSKYCFDQNGIIRTGWRRITDTTPAMKGYMYFKEESTEEFKYGEAIVNSWYSIEPPTEIIPTSEVKYFYFNGQGVPRCAPVGSFIRVRLNEKTYLFNEFGYTVYGVRLVDGEYYYFGDSVTECSMKTGLITNKDIEGTGENNSYYFEGDGKGYTGVYNNKLYYCGKLQKAQSEQKYAAFNIKGVLKLVNTQGNIMKNKSKVKDGDDCRWSTNSSGNVTYKDDDATINEPIAPEINTES